jgi:hypothetical protein
MFRHCLKVVLGLILAFILVLPFRVNFRLCSEHLSEVLEH